MVITICTFASACPEKAVLATAVAVTTTWISHDCTPAAQSGTVVGAVYMPVESMLPRSVAGDDELAPRLKLQVTAWLVELGVIAALNFWVEPTATGDGVGATVTISGCEPPPPPPLPGA